MSELINKYRTPDTMRVISNVTMTGVSKLRGAYYLIEFPQAAQKNYPIFLGIFIVQNRLCFTIICEIKSDAYEFLRLDVEDILKSFRVFNVH